MLQSSLSCLARLVLVGLVSLTGIASRVVASEGQIEINQASALAGDITPGDAPGFPVTITRSGSYRLTSDLLVRGANAHMTDGIRIEAANVTLDLGGFVLRCEIPNLPAPLACSSSSGTGGGISVVGAGNIRLTNGAVRGFAGRGVEFLAGASEFHASHLRIRGSGTSGFWAGANGILTNSSSTGNGYFGIDVTAGTTLVLDTTTSGNAASGLRALGGSAAAGRSDFEDGVQYMAVIDCNRIEGVNSCP
jgi:hypothetical protein